MVLRILVEHAILDDQHVQARAHEAVERVFRSAGDRLSTYVEAGVDDHGATGLAIEAVDQSMEPRVGLAMHGLEPRAPIDVRDSWDQ